MFFSLFLSQRAVIIRKSLFDFIDLNVGREGGFCFVKLSDLLSAPFCFLVFVLVLASLPDFLLIKLVYDVAKYHNKKVLLSFNL